MERRKLRTLSDRQKQDARVPTRHLQVEDSNTNSSTATAEGDAGKTVDWSYLSGSNATADGFGVVHVGSNETEEWQDIFPNGSIVKIVYVSGSGSSDTIVIVPDDDASASGSDPSSTSAFEDSSSGSLNSTANPVYIRPPRESNSSSSSGDHLLTESSASELSTLSYAVIYSVVAVFVIVAGVFMARRYTRKQREDVMPNPDRNPRTYDLSAIFNANRSRRRASSPSILGDELERWRQQRSTDLQASSLRPTSILADNETVGPRRPTVSLTPLRRTDRLVRATLEANRLRSSTAPVVLYPNP